MGGISKYFVTHKYVDQLQRYNDNDTNGSQEVIHQA